MQINSGTRVGAHSVTRGLVSCQVRIFIRTHRCPSDAESQDKSSSSTTTLKLRQIAGRTVSNRSNPAKEQFLMLHVQYMRVIDPAIECVLQYSWKNLLIFRNKWNFYSLFHLFWPLSCMCVCTHIRYNTYISASSFCQMKEMSSSNIIFFLLIKQEDAINFEEREGLILFPLPPQTHWKANISKSSSLLSHSLFSALHSCFEAAVLKGSDTEISNPVSTSQQDFWVLLKIRQHFFCAEAF